MTDQTQNFINDLARKMSTQEIRATQFPLYYVYEKEDLWVNEDNFDRVGFANDEGLKITEIQDEEGNTWQLDKDNFNEWVCIETEERISDIDAEDKFGLKKVYIKEVSKPVVNVGPFLTEEAAKKHIEANYYHYNEPYIYVNSAWRNYEMQELMQIIFELAGVETPNWYK
jgi:hypothetical protein